MTTEKKYLDVPFEVKESDIKEDGSFSGHASLFDQVPDAHRDLVARGAFKDSLAEGGRNKSGIPMLWQHRSDKLPGVWLSLMEDTKGLMVKGQLALETQLGRDVYEIMLLGAKAGTFKFGLSIGYDPKDFSYHTPKGQDRKVRTLKKVDLWEISIVTFPAKIGANITDVKKIDIEQIECCTNERDLEKVLRESGLSKCAAQYVVKKMKPSLREANAGLDNGMLPGILDSLKKFNQNISNAEILGTLKRINS